MTRINDSQKQKMNPCPYLNSPHHPIQIIVPNHFVGHYKEGNHLKVSRWDQ